MEKSSGVPALPASQALALARLTIGTMFVWVFFENLGKHLYSAGPYAGLIHFYIQKSAAPAIWKSVMAATAAHASIAAPLQGFAEITMGVLLILGLFSRPVALAACTTNAQFLRGPRRFSLAACFLLVAAVPRCGYLASLLLSEWGTAWIWELLTPVLICLALALGSPGQSWGLDGWLKRRFPAYPLA